MYSIRIRGIFVNQIRVVAFVRNSRTNAMLLPWGNAVRRFPEVHPVALLYASSPHLIVCRPRQLHYAANAVKILILSRHVRDRATEHYYSSFCIFFVLLFVLLCVLFHVFYCSCCIRAY